jgi:CheY-like chemotaxis protein
MQGKILWADDEVDLLKAHLMFLEQKGYTVSTVTNGYDALEELEENLFDIVFLDENMPGISGLETLERIKKKHPSLPVIMITKSEEEMIMEEAIGSKISDYLIKPVNPNQILLSLRKNLEGKELVSKRSFNTYRQSFAELSMELSDCRDFKDYCEYFKKLTYWSQELESVNDQGIQEVLKAQFKEANNQFSKFIQNDYEGWFHEEMGDAPILSNNFMQKWLAPKLKKAVENDKQLFWLVLDNLRYDQWLTLKPIISEWFVVKEEDLTCSILPTATHYARNALFAGMMPSEIKKQHPNLWVDEDHEGSKNANEEELLNLNLKRLGFDFVSNYTKVTHLDGAKKLVDNFNQLKNNRLVTVVYNFIDTLSHARTDSDMIKELAEDEAAYRSLTKSWFEHSPLYDFLKMVKETGGQVIISTDHGSVKVTDPVKVVGDRQTSTNLRYKQGRSLTYKEKEVFAVAQPEHILLPKQNLSSSFIFAKNQDFFVYPNNLNKFVKYYENTFQHGGVSLEEMVIPAIYLESK